MLALQFTPVLALQLTLAAIMLTFIVSGLSAGAVYNHFFNKGI